MATVSKGKLKPHLLAYLRGVEESRDPLIITDHHVPVLQIIPYSSNESPGSLFKEEQGKVKYAENVWATDPDSWGDLL